MSKSPLLFGGQIYLSELLSSGAKVLGLLAIPTLPLFWSLIQGEIDENDKNAVEKAGGISMPNDCVSLKSSNQPAANVRLCASDVMSVTYPGRGGVMVGGVLIPNRDKTYVIDFNSQAAARFYVDQNTHHYVMDSPRLIIADDDYSAAALQASATACSVIDSTRGLNEGQAQTAQKACDYQFRHVRMRVRL